MLGRTITERSIKRFIISLEDAGKAVGTIEKYERDVRKLAELINGRRINIGLLQEFRETIKTKYEVVTANSIISAVNHYLRYMGWEKYRILHIKQQRKVFCEEHRELTKAEYQRLLKAAKEKKNERLNLIIQTICATGIRISELSYITVESLQDGRTTVNCKGKSRRVFIPNKLRRQLEKYCKKRKIETGIVFITKSGRPMNRSNIWRDMKGLCKEAGVDDRKVFPHNLRHLFARTYYSLEKDIAKLADILGHTNIETTRIYIMTSGREHSRQIERLELVC